MHVPEKYLPDQKASQEISAPVKKRDDRVLARHLLSEAYEGFFRVHEFREEAGNEMSLPKEGSWNPRV